jgi:hypothetical protein
MHKVLLWSLILGLRVQVVHLFTLSSLETFVMFEEYEEDGLN